MNFEKIKTAAIFSPGASMGDLLRLEVELGRPVPNEYKVFMQLTDGALFDSGLMIYSAGEVYERNKTFSFFEYLPDYLSIGDDSGGQSIIIPYEGLGVYLVGHGFLDKSNFEVLGGTLEEWINNGCFMS